MPKESVKVAVDIMLTVKPSGDKPIRKRAVKAAVLKHLAGLKVDAGTVAKVRVRSLDID